MSRMLMSSARPPVPSLSRLASPRLVSLPECLAAMISISRPTAQEHVRVILESSVTTKEKKRIKSEDAENDLGDIMGQTLK